MPSQDARISHVSDTALMVAACRAMETARPDGFVRDEFAAALAGERGMAIAEALPRLHVMCFGIGTRSHFLDDLLMNAVRDRAIKTVLCLGSGLDARPYRLDLPAELRWIEVDFADMLDYKAGVLQPFEPKCRLERIAADLNDPAQRRDVFSAVGTETALMITEGLLMYLPASTVEAIAAEPAAASGIRYWIADITSPEFARAVQMDTYKDVERMRAEGHLNGLEILDRMQQSGWSSIDRRSYVTDMAFAADRIRQMMGQRPSNAPPPQPVPPTDPTGVHLLGIER